MTVEEYFDPVQRDWFIAHFDWLCYRLTGEWMPDALTFNGPRALAGPQIGGADGAQS